MIVFKKEKARFKMNGGAGWSHQMFFTALLEISYGMHPDAAWSAGGKNYLLNWTGLTHCVSHLMYGVQMTVTVG
jgi:hypothetical protein